MERYEHLEKAMCEELKKLDKKYSGDVDGMTEKDVEQADKLYHSLKSAATYYAMKEAEEENEMENKYSERGGGRGYRGASYARDGRMGRRDGGYSGYYPPTEYVDPYWDRRY